MSGWMLQRVTARIRALPSVTSTPTREAVLGIRDRYRQRASARLTPAERMEHFAALQETCMAELRSNPEGYRRFLARNYRKRAVKGNADELAGN
jgi:hypothetical protein